MGERTQYAPGALERVTELGGAVHAGPIDVEAMRIAVVADPQGATFALYDGALEG